VNGEVLPRSPPNQKADPGQLLTFRGSCENAARQVRGLKVDGRLRRKRFMRDASDNSVGAENSDCARRLLPDCFGTAPPN